MQVVCTAKREDQGINKRRNLKNMPISIILLMDKENEMIACCLRRNISE